MGFALCSLPIANRLTSVGYAVVIGCVCFVYSMISLPKRQGDRFYRMLFYRNTAYFSQIMYCRTCSLTVSGSAEMLTTKLIFSCAENLSSQARKVSSASTLLSLTSL